MSAENGVVTMTVIIEVLGAKSFYEVLGVEGSPATSEAEIKAAYRQRCLALHPDKQQQLTSSAVVYGEQTESDLARVAFDKVAAAHEWLADADRRSAYDCMGGTGVDVAEIKQRASLAMMAKTVGQALAGMVRRCASAGCTNSPVGLSSSYCAKCLAEMAGPIYCSGRNGSCKEVVPIKGLMCAQCAMAPVGKEGRCKNLGCLNKIAKGREGDDDGSGVCVACRNRPKKCTTLGCFMMVKPPATLCPKHSNPH